jgi:D-alanyl-D-alanine carboxypeptidase-like protein
VATSQNGWPAGTPAQIGLDNSAVPGTDVKLPQGVRHGDVATVLHYVGSQFDTHVEPLHAGSCWGYAYRHIESSASLSNHASGTAIDLNAARHPTGARGTFSAAKVAAIRTILHFCQGVVRWGGDYTGRKDEMHFEIVEGAAEVARVAKKIRTAPAPRSPSPAKRAPTALKLDGILGPATIRRWQQVMGTPADGRITEPSELVKAVQRRLNAHGADLSVDGRGIRQDGHTYHTVRALQRYLGVTPTGALTRGKSSPTIVALQRRLNSGRF